MPTAVRTLLLLLVIALPATFLTAQNGAEPIFTISVTAPTSAKDVQLRSFLKDEAGAHWSSTQAMATQSKLVVVGDAAGRVPKTFNAIAYAPGCQFVTFSAEDLTTSMRQGEFQCLKLPTLQLRGTIPMPPSKPQFDVEAMYVVNWAGKFFSVPHVSISPLALTSTAVEADGSFTMELPDFTADPLWNSMSRDATLMFFLVDHASGHRIAGLKAPAALAKNGDLKVAASYPDVVFSLRQTQTAKAMKPGR